MLDGLLPGVIIGLLAGTAMVFMRRRGFGLAPQLVVAAALGALVGLMVE